MSNDFFDWPVSGNRFVPFDAAQAEDLNSALDTVSIGFDSVQVKTNSALKLPDGESSTTFPNAASRKGKVVGFNQFTGAVEPQYLGDAEANVLAWVSGQTYAAGDRAYSLSNYQTYRRTTSGAGTTDPISDGTNWARLGIERDWAEKAANYTAMAFDRILADTSAGAWTLTLPAAPATGDQISLIDIAGTFATNNLTVASNGLKIMGLAEDMTISDNNIALTLLYTGATYGWRIF